MAKERLNITIDTDTRDRLNKIADREGKSVSALISSWTDRDIDGRIEELKLLQEQNEKIFNYRNKVYAEIDKAITDCDFDKAQEIMRIYL